jgi:hypothetical protein
MVRVFVRGSVGDSGNFLGSDKELALFRASFPWVSHWPTLPCVSLLTYAVGVGITQGIEYSPGITYIRYVGR